MKKIGILTLNGNFNYGNKLQNFAMKKILEDYHFKVFTIKYLLNPIYVLNELFQEKTLNEKIRLTKFKDFNKKLNYKFLPRFQFQKLRVWNPYDFVIYGSDQIWKYGKKGISNIFSGYLFPKKSNIAYAASFGVSEIPTCYQNGYKEMINQFKDISVREEAGEKIISSLNPKINVEIVLDPTLLVDSDSWNDLSTEIPTLIGKKYILNYFLGTPSDDKKKVIEKIARDNNCIIIDLLDKNCEYYSSGPSEFLYLEKNAFLICTDSFHSCVFAFIFDRPFIVFDREDNNENMGSRIDTLLSTFELQDRKYSDNVKKECLSHNYSTGYKILEEKKKQSFAFLEKALCIKDSD